MPQQLIYYKLNGEIKREWTNLSQAEFFKVLKHFIKETDTLEPYKPKRSIKRYRENKFDK